MRKPPIDWEDAAEKVVLTITRADGSETREDAWVSRKDGQLYTSEHHARYNGTTGTMPCGAQMFPGSGDSGCPGRKRPGCISCDGCQHRRDVERLARQAEGRPRWEGQFPCWFDDDFMAEEEDAEIWADQADWGGPEEERGQRSVPVVYEAVRAEPPVFRLGDLLDGWPEGSDEPLGFLDSLETRALEKMVNEYVRAHRPEWYNQGLPYSGGYEAWATERLDWWRE